MDIRITHVIELSPSLMALLVSSVSGAALAAAPAPTTRPQPEPAAEPAAGGEAVETVTEGQIDAAGWPWSPELHASTKGLTKDGLWRMKVGVSRPEPKPGFPVASSGGTTTTTSTGAESGASATAPAGSAGAGDDEDEFAAFRAAADKANATDATAAAAVTARKWTDADLGALCNQAAVKLGDPAPVKALIAAAVPEGAVPHSRNIPDAGREAFAQAVEKAAGIEFAG
jgi:hypothetical protein